MSYASDHIFGFPIKKEEEETRVQSSSFRRGTIGWCNEMAYEYEKAYIQMKKENEQLKQVIAQLEEKINS